MHRVKILGLAVMAVLAVAAVVASASASAAMTLPEFVTKTGWAGTSGAGRLLQGTADEIKCTAGTNSGTMEASKKLGTLTITFTGCKSEKPISGAKCNSTGDASETILTAGSWHIVLLTGPKGEDFHLIWILLTPLTVKCSIFEFAIKGNVLGEITPGNTLTKKYALKVALVGGKQEFTSFENDNGELVAAKLESNGESATEESANNVLTTTEDTLIIN
jgi:hypothetical protein